METPTPKYQVEDIVILLTPKEAKRPSDEYGHLDYFPHMYYKDPVQITGIDNDYEGEVTYYYANGYWYEDYMIKGLAAVVSELDTPIPV